MTRQLVSQLHSETRCFQFCTNDMDCKSLKFASCFTKCRLLLIWILIGRAGSDDHQRSLSYVGLDYRMFHEALLQWHLFTLCICIPLLHLIISNNYIFDLHFFLVCLSLCSLLFPLSPICLLCFFPDVVKTHILQTYFRILVKLLLSKISLNV